MPGMQVVDALSTLRAQVQAWKRAGERIGFVPTMGNLHAGHYSLVKLARENADHVVASVFVNPAQFGPNEDFARYPRTPQRDIDGLRDAGCALAWLPDVATVYPFGVEQAVRMHVPGLSDVLEGAHRPGHFDGVATVVSRLLLQVQPDVAVFGRKDYQQLAVIRRLVDDLGFPVQVVGGDTRREPDGLAMSSRNQYLSPAERVRAATIHQVLQAMRTAALAGEAAASIEAAAVAELQSLGFAVDYTALRRPDLGHASELDTRLVALVAARLGATRLIDNLQFDRPG